VPVPCVLRQVAFAIVKKAGLRIRAGGQQILSLTSFDDPKAHHSRITVSQAERLRGAVSEQQAVVRLVFTNTMKDERQWNETNIRYNRSRKKRERHFLL
jgi:hypothetical protein